MVWVCHSMVSTRLRKLGLLRTNIAGASADSVSITNTSSGSVISSRLNTG